MNEKYYHLNNKNDISKKMTYKKIYMQSVFKSSKYNYHLPRKVIQKDHYIKKEQY